MKNKRKKRFYKNAKRDEKWTETPRGHEIDFADKYVTDEYSDKYDYLRPKEEKKKKKKKKFDVGILLKHLKRLGIVLGTVLIVFVGYTAMDVYMQRTGLPSIDEATEDTEDEASLSNITLSLSSDYVDSVSLDGSVMLEAIIDEAEDLDYNSITFDIKRSDGTVGYKSSLSVVDTYSAISFPSSNLKTSVATLNENDILTVGRVYCYLDNLAPEANTDIAVYSATGAVYHDSQDNTYLNPDSDTVYNYIKDIISETKELGVTVFALDGYDLPSEISDSYNDGFDYIAEKLYDDIGTGIKLLKAVNVTLTQSQIEDGLDEDEVAEKFSEQDDDDVIYFITTTADETEVLEQLEAWGITNFILS